MPSSAEYIEQRMLSRRVRSLCRRSLLLGFRLLLSEVVKNHEDSVVYRDLIRNSEYSLCSMLLPL